MAPDEEQTLREEWDGLLFGVQCSIRYHVCRQAFYDRWHMRVTALSVIFSSAAIVALMSSSSTLFGLQDTTSKILVIVASAIVSIASALDLVVGNTTRATLHHDFVRRFSSLERKMCRVTNPTAADISRYTAKRLSIEAEEPPTLQVVHAMCYNELCRAREAGLEVVITGPQRWLAHYRDYNAHRLPKRHVDISVQPAAVPRRWWWSDGGPSEPRR